MTTIPGTSPLATPSRLAVVILAAGAGRRLGIIKPLAVVDGQTLLRRAADTARQLPGADLFLVVGAQSPIILASEDAKGPGVIHNTGWQEGMASSLRRAVQELDAYPAILFLAVDQPLITPLHLIQLANLWRQQPDRKVAAWYGERPGIPAIFPRRCYPALARLQGDTGAKALLCDAGDPPLTLAIPEGAADVDTPAALRQIEIALLQRHDASS